MYYVIGFEDNPLNLGDLGRAELFTIFQIHILAIPSYQITHAYCILYTVYIFYIDKLDGIIPNVSRQIVLVGETLVFIK